MKEEALVIEKASEEVEEIDEEVALILTDFQFPNQAKVEHRETPNLLNDVKEIMATKIQSKMAPTPEPVKMAPTPEPIKMAPTPEPVKMAPTTVKMASEPVKMAPTPEPIKMAPTPEPVKMTPTPVKMASEPVKIAPSPILAPSPEPVKMAPTPEPVKMVPTPEPANPFITPKFNNTVKPPDIITSPPVAAPAPAPAPLSPPSIAQVHSKELRQFNTYKMHSNYNLEFSKESAIWSILIQE